MSVAMLEIIRTLRCLFCLASEPSPVHQIQDKHARIADGLPPNTTL